jgi:hypothetical protein
MGQSPLLHHGKSTSNQIFPDTSANDNNDTVKKTNDASKGNSGSRDNSGSSGSRDNSGSSGSRDNSGSSGSRDNSGSSGSRDNSSESSDNRGNTGSIFSVIHLFL